MLGAGVDLELLVHLGTQGALGQHAAHCVLDDAGGVLLHGLGEGLGLEVSHITGVAVVDLVGGLGAGDLDLLGVDNHDKVAGVDVGGVGRLVLATQDLGNLRGKAAEGHVGRIDQKPLALDFARLRVIGLHGYSSKKLNTCCSIT